MKGVQFEATESSKLDGITKSVVEGSELVQENLPAHCLSRALHNDKVSVAVVQSKAPRCESVLLYIDSGATTAKKVAFSAWNAFMKPFLYTALIRERSGLAATIAVG